jgi:hypothetical protein
LALRGDLPKIKAIIYIFEGILLDVLIDYQNEE